MSAQRRLQQLERHLSPGQRPAGDLERHATTAAGHDAVQYSVPLPEKLTATGPWLVHRSALAPERLTSTFPPPEDHIRTLYDNLEHSITRYPHEPYLGQRVIGERDQPGPYHWMTYEQVGDDRSAIGSGFLHYGLKPGDRVGLYSVNCRDWVLVEAACNAFSLVSVPLYDTLGPDVVAYICGHAELRCVACSIAVLPTLLAVLHECPSVQLVVVYGQKIGQALPGPPAGCSARILALETVKRAGRERPRPHGPPSPHDVATFCYTSGTTGVPKGAVLTHANLIANAAGGFQIINAQPGDRHISYLPLAHIYERVTVIGLTHCGVALGFYRGDVALLLEDILELRPTIFASVPRLWNRIYDKVLATIRAGNPVARRLYETGYAYKRAALERGDPSGGRFGPFWDALVFSKIRARLGGQVKIMTTGASPISAEVLAFLRIAFGATVLEGYGMTESACTISLTHPDDTSTGHVGAPLSCCEVKLHDIPEMGYTTADKPHPRGEVCVRGPTVFQGYYKDEAQTAEMLDGDGWLHTGDVGQWLPGGRLQIIDRKKNIFKLAQGEYIAPEKIENIYARCALVAQAFVHGDSLKPQLVAIVVPDPETLLPWAAARGLPQDMAKLCAEASVTSAVLKGMLEEGRVAQLRGFEQVAAITLTPEPFSVENKMLTPTFKLKRPQAKAHFQAAIARMYSSLE